MEKDRLQQFLDYLSQFQEDREWDQFHDIKNLSMALMAEVGELQEILMWTDSGDVDARLSAKRKQIEEEVGDIGIYLLLLCRSANIDLLEAMKSKMDLNEKKYPVDKAKGTSKKYNEF